MSTPTPGPGQEPAPEQSFYDEIGGEATIRRVVEVFYAGVASDPVLRPMYPEEDLGPAEERFALFLCQYWGGPTTYSEQRGHPRLRMRHAPFAVTPTAAGHWLKHFRTGLDAVGLTPEQDARFWEYVVHAAQFMVNTHDDPVGGQPVLGPDGGEAPGSGGQEPGEGGTLRIGQR